MSFSDLVRKSNELKAQCKCGCEHLSKLMLIKYTFQTWIKIKFLIVREEERTFQNSCLPKNWAICVNPN